MLTREQRERVKFLLDEYGGNYEKVCKKTGLGKRIIQEIDIVENRKFNYTEEGRGRVELQPYIIQIVSVNNSAGWDNTQPKVKKAHELYDQGLVEICTGRDGMNLILYAIPRQMKGKRRYYFTAPPSNIVPIGA